MNRFQVASLLTVALLGSICAAQDQHQACTTCLERSESRSDTLKCVRRFTDSCISEVIVAAKSEGGSVQKRYYAIWVLGAIASPEAIKVLDELTEDGKAGFRCAAMSAFRRDNSDVAFPILIRKLDDHSVCQISILNNPRQDVPVEVADVSIEVLHRLTGIPRPSNETQQQALQRWKQWWESRQKTTEAPK